jgi:hypothetical protein
MRSVTASRRSAAVSGKAAPATPAAGRAARAWRRYCARRSLRQRRIEVNGRPRRVSKGQATVALLIDRAAETDPRWMKLLLDLLQKLETRSGRSGDDEDEEGDAESARERLIREIDRLSGNTPEASAVRDFLAGAQ